MENNLNKESILLTPEEMKICRQKNSKKFQIACQMGNLIDLKALTLSVMDEQLNFNFLIENYFKDWCRLGHVNIIDFFCNHPDSDKKEICRGKIPEVWGACVSGAGQHTFLYLKENFPLEFSNYISDDEGVVERFSVLCTCGDLQGFQFLERQLPASTASRSNYLLNSMSISLYSNQKNVFDYLIEKLAASTPTNQQKEELISTALFTGNFEKLGDLVRKLNINLGECITSLNLLNHIPRHIKEMKDLITDYHYRAPTHVREEFFSFFSSVQPGYPGYEAYQNWANLLIAAEEKDQIDKELELSQSEPRCNRLKINKI